MKTITAHPNFFYDLENKIEDSLSQSEKYTLFESDYDYESFEKDDFFRKEVRTKLQRIEQGILENRSINKSDILFVNECYKKTTLIDIDRYVFYNVVGSRLYFFIFQPLLFILSFLCIFQFKHYSWTQTYIFEVSLVSTLVVLFTILLLMFIAFILGTEIPKKHRLKCTFKKLHKLI